MQNSGVFLLTDFWNMTQDTGKVNCDACIRAWASPGHPLQGGQSYSANVRRIAQHLTLRGTSSWMFFLFLLLLFSLKIINFFIYLFGGRAELYTARAKACRMSVQHDISLVVLSGKQALLGTKASGALYAWCYLLAFSVLVFYICYFACLILISVLNAPFPKVLLARAHEMLVCSARQAGSFSPREKW